MVKKLELPRYLGFRQLEENDNGYTLYLGYTDFTKKKVELDKDGLEFLMFFITPKTLEEAATNFNIDKDSVNSFVVNLEKEGILKEYKELEIEKYARYDRHLLYYEMIGAEQGRVQKKITASKVGLIGMGGHRELGFSWTNWSRLRRTKINRFR